MSVLVFFIYITNSQVVRELYSNTTLLWFIGPLLIYWLNRMWFLAQRGTIDGDPVPFCHKRLCELDHNIFDDFIYLFKLNNLAERQALFTNKPFGLMGQVDFVSHIK